MFIDIVVKAVGIQFGYAAVVIGISTFVSKYLDNKHKKEDEINE